ncbi:unnamed protein product, partial [Prorocentrum cordatum]
GDNPTSAALGTVTSQAAPKAETSAPVEAPAKGVEHTPAADAATKQLVEKREVEPARAEVAKPPKRSRGATKCHDDQQPPKQPRKAARQQQSPNEKVDKQALAKAKENFEMCAKVKARGESMVWNVSNMDEWSWAKNDPLMPELDAGLKKLTEHAMEVPILQKVMSMEFTAMKSTLSEKDFTAALGALPQPDGPLNAVREVLNALQGCHGQRQK